MRSRLTIPQVTWETGSCFRARRYQVGWRYSCSGCTLPSRKIRLLAGGASSWGRTLLSVWDHELESTLVVWIRAAWLRVGLSSGVILQNMKSPNSVLAVEFMIAAIQTASIRHSWVIHWLINAAATLFSTNKHIIAHKVFSSITSLPLTTSECWKLYTFC